MGFNIQKLINIIFILFLIACSKNEEIEEETNANPFTGLWELYIIESKDSTKNWQPAEWMRNGKGNLHYDDNENMSVHFIPHNYGSVDSIKAYWYVAKYKIIADSNIVEHTRIFHSNLEEVGKTVKRYYKFKGDTLIMNAKEFGLRLKWIKQ